MYMVVIEKKVETIRYEVVTWHNKEEESIITDVGEARKRLSQMRRDYPDTNYGLLELSYVT